MKEIANETLNVIQNKLYHIYVTLSVTGAPASMVVEKSIEKEITVFGLAITEFTAIISATGALILIVEKIFSMYLNYKKHKREEKEQND